MPSLAQVFQLVNRYGADRVQFDIETKLDPTLPKETVGPTTFAKKVIAVISRYHMTKRSVLQSFDWSTLQAARKIKPRLRRVGAGPDAPTIFPGTPWTGGIDIKPNPFNGDLARVVADKLHAAGPLGQLPRHHRRAHQRVAPPRPDDHPVDRRRPGRHGRRHRPRPRRPHHRLPRPRPRRDGRQGPRPAASRSSRPSTSRATAARAAYRPENTLSAYRYGLDHGVDTLEMDIGVTKDGVLVMSHNRQVNGVHCHDTAPATPGDPLFPYAGKNIKDLTLAQIKTLDCGFTDPGFPKQVRQPGEQMPTLQEVFDLVAARGDTHVRFNIETKISPLVDDTVALRRHDAPSSSRRSRTTACRTGP